MKKMLTWLLVVAMVLAMVPMAVSAESEMMTVYFRNDWLWSDVKVHYWGGSSSSEWAGDLMTYVETIDGLDYYSAQVPADSTGLIFNGWDVGQDTIRQTPNIEGESVKADTCYYIFWDNTEQYGIVEGYPAADEETTSIPSTLYLNPGSDWDDGSSRFAAYFFGDGEAWVSMTAVNGTDLYQAEVPADKSYTNVIFCQMPGDNANNDWDTKKNQTKDLTLSAGNNLFTITNPWDGASEWKALGDWSTFRAILDNLRTLNVEDEIYLNQYVKVLGCDGVDIAAQGGLLVWKTAVDAENAVVGSSVAHEQIEGLVVGNGEYAQQTSGISAKNYADKLYLRVYVQIAEGEYLYSDLITYSVRDYCEKQINDATATAAVCTQLLYYGAAAQVQFNYNTEDLANKNIVEDVASVDWDSSYLTAVSPANTQLVGTGDVKDNGKTLALEGSMKLNFYFQPDGFVADSGKLLVWEDVADELTLDNASYEVEMIAGTNEFGAQIKPVFTRNYGKTIYVCAAFTDAEDKVHYSNVIPYSVEAYAASILAKTAESDTIQAVVKQLVLLGEVYANYNATRNA